MLRDQILYWFAIYLAVGLPSLILLRLMVYFLYGPSPYGGALDDIMQEIRGNGSLRVRSIRLAGKVLMFPLILLIWPLVVGLVLQYRFSSSGRDWKSDPEAAFHCKRSHLVRVVTPEAAEAAAFVVDPLGRVPDLPFGHLNAGWRALLADRQIGDSLWYFEVPGHTPAPDAEAQRHQYAVPRGTKRGYALVQSRKVRAEFVFEWD